MSRRPLHNVVEMIMLLLLLLLLCAIIQNSQTPRHGSNFLHRPNFPVIYQTPAACGRPILLVPAPTSALEVLAGGLSFGSAPHPYPNACPDE